jgi:hypothetical protein
MARALLCVLLLAAGGCGKLLGFDDVRRCEGAECTGGGGDDPDAGDAPACETADECQPDAPVCDTGAGSCRTCESHDECEAIDPAAPACSPDGTCVECVLDSHCPSEVCDTGDSTCVAEEDVVYMAPDGSTDGDCGAKDDPCKLFASALALVEGARQIVKVGAGTYNGDPAPILIPDGLTVTLLAAGATVDPAADGTIFSIGAGATFTMRGGQVSGATGGTSAHGLLCAATATLRLFGVTVADNAGDGVHCPGTAVLEDITASDNGGDGISGAGGVNLRVTRGTVSGNDDGISSAETTAISQVDVVGNTGFGLSCHDTCEVTRSKIRSNASGGIDAINGEGVYLNNFITGNGAAEGGSVGGAFLWPDEGAVLFAHNTVVGNFMRSAGVGGVHCVDGDITSANNIVYGNLDAMDKPSNTNVPCHMTYSDIEEVGVNPDNNIDFPPSFTAGYHIVADAACVDHGNASAVGIDVDVDLDGDERPYGDGPDCGCDEYVPPR